MNKEETICEKELKDITIDYGNGNYIHISPNEISVVGDKIEFIKKSEPNELDIENLQQQNQKYKEVIDRLKEIIMQPNIEIREYHSCDMDYIYANEQLLDILKEVE